MKTIFLVIWIAEGFFRIQKKTFESKEDAENFASQMRNIDGVFDLEVIEAVVDWS